jgi:hypothetical protein
MGQVVHWAFSPTIQRLSVSLRALLRMQFCSIHFKAPLHLEVLHLLVGFMLFYVSPTLVYGVGRSLLFHHDRPQQIDDNRSTATANVKVC